MRFTSLLLQMAFVGLAGCVSSGHFAAESRNAQESIDRAESAGADEHARCSVELARDTMKEARTAEDLATKDRDDAQEQLDRAQKRGVEARATLDAKRDQLARTRDDQESQELAIARIESRTGALRSKGVSEAELHGLEDVQQALARGRLASIEAAIAALSEQVALRELEQKDAQLDACAARARIVTADQRLQVARRLYERAGHLAKVAEAESLNIERLGLQAKITETSP